MRRWYDTRVTAVRRDGDPRMPETRRVLAHAERVEGCGDVALSRAVSYAEGSQPETPADPTVKSYVMCRGGVAVEVVEDGSPHHVSAADHPAPPFPPIRVERALLALFLE